MNKFKTYLNRQLKELDSLEANWAQLDAPWETTEYMIQETADHAAKLGLAELYKKSLNLKGTFSDCKFYLAECLSSIKTESDTLSVQEAAKRLGISTNKMYDLCRNNEIVCQRIGRSIRIRPEDLVIKSHKGFRHL
jgi:excisionase family DNA binding protein